MESNYRNREFEQFLKQNADQYRMFPSEKVWKGIDNALHTRRRWYGLGLALLLILTGAGVTLVMMTTPVDKNTLAKVTEQTIPQNKTVEPAATVPVYQNEPVDFSKKQETNNSKPVYNSILLQSPVNNRETVPVVISHADLSSEIMIAPAYQDHPNNVAIAENSPIIVSAPAFLVTDNKTQGDVVSSTITEAGADNSVKANETIAANDYLLAPYTIESVVNSYKRPVSRKQVRIQVYMAPTISYRKLSQNKAFLRSAAFSGTVPASVAYRDVNNAVTHKPDIGLELGAAAKYPLTKGIMLKAGLQFNLSRYDIRAFNNPGEIATIALDAGAGNNSISRETFYRNYNGARTNWLQNLYYTASIPVGVEVRFPTRNKNYFGIAGTVQPTYIISDRAYLLSTDYKNYVEVPSLIRRWNMNTGFEAFVGYKTRRGEWQIGPQVRYQTRSSFVDQYPLKENLFDFGLKVGLLFNK